MKIRNRGLLTGLILAAVALAATATIDPNLYLNDIKFLASPELRGRGTGSPELEKAAAYLERNYRQLGIKPAGKSYLQPFPVTTDATLGKTNRFQFTENGSATTLQFPGAHQGLGSFLRPDPGHQRGRISADHLLPGNIQQPRLRKRRSAGGRG